MNKTYIYIPLGFLGHYNGLKYIVLKTKVLFINSLFIYYLMTTGLPGRAQPLVNYVIT